MKKAIFISWSGPRSATAARALQDLLEEVLLNVKVWVSHDIEPGEEWFTALSKALAESGFGILCLTQGNTKAPWIAFEAGTLMKAFGKGRVCPFLIDIEIEKDKLGPLSPFQAVDANKDGTWRLVQSINGNCAAKAHELLTRRFENSWPKFEGILKGIQNQEDPLTPEDRLEKKIDLQHAKIEALSHTLEKLALVFGPLITEFVTAQTTQTGQAK